MEIKQTFSITIPICLYQKLLQEIGRGKISKFIQQIIEEKLNQEKESLGLAYQECYTNNFHLLIENKQWEKIQDQDWINWNKNVKKRK